MKNLRLQDPNARRSPPETRRNNGPPRKLEKSTTEIPQLKWEVLTPARGM